MEMVKRFDIYLLSLDEPLTKNARNTRPCVVVSPNEMNENLPHVLVAPVSTSVRRFPTRIGFEFLNRERTIVIDQIRAVESSRLVKKIGELEPEARTRVLKCLAEFFAE
jgi:mRNA interferase MazF